MEIISGFSLMWVIYINPLILLYWIIWSFLGQSKKRLSTQRKNNYLARLFGRLNLLAILVVLVTLFHGITGADAFRLLGLSLSINASIALITGKDGLNFIKNESLAINIRKGLAIFASVLFGLYIHHFPHVAG